ncbi:MAG: hypothetical protein ACLUCA_11185 [Mediterraneibacter gnavus]
MIHDFIKNICDILDIPTPLISHNTSNFPTETMLAQVDSLGNTIYIRKFDKPNPDLFFSVAHELRHVWQIRYHKKEYLSSYESMDILKSTKQYNLQLAEIDANAFAYIVMVDFFGIKPLFRGLSDDVKLKIMERVNEIATELSE